MKYYCLLILKLDTNYFNNFVEFRKLEMGKNAKDFYKSNEIYGVYVSDKEVYEKIMNFFNEDEKDPTHSDYLGNHTMTILEERFAEFLLMFK